MNLKVFRRGQKYVLFQSMLPKHMSRNFTDMLLNLYLHFFFSSLSIGADMNATLNPGLDRSLRGNQHSENLASTAFQGWVLHFSLIDLFCIRNPSSRQYTFIQIDLKLILEETIYWCHLTFFFFFAVS